MSGSTQARALRVSSASKRIVFDLSAGDWPIVRVNRSSVSSNAQRCEPATEPGTLSRLTLHHYSNQIVARRGSYAALVRFEANPDQVPNSHGPLADLFSAGLTIILAPSRSYGMNHRRRKWIYGTLWTLQLR